MAVARVTPSPSVALQGVYFPDWWPRFEWRAIGRGEDRIDGRVAITVYYPTWPARLAYTIVSAPALRVPPTRAARVNGIECGPLRSEGGWS
jgi:hypothetical protein